MFLCFGNYVKDVPKLTLVFDRFQTKTYNHKTKGQTNIHLQSPYVGSLVTILLLHFNCNVNMLEVEIHT